MQQDTTQRISSHPKFAELVTRRTRLGLILSLIVMAMYFAFILAVAFAPKALGASLAGGVTTVGIPIGILIIVTAFLLTGIYVRRANAEFDELNRQIIEDTV
ncbi:DUF485 domain-containing protein [Rhodospirillum centenum]|uniref:Inner membrane protein YjcH, putative n=1 Tax=Rhodospirillum centenum (strain ATCC 51521 / SW) TaxID=414684 RepID=B6IUU7_RHOCS|nr:DUF485 domain-containing protein [Rhodospirillum centenum]ACJ00029.1 inner membrane protein YjcH, putative [Rhodospirillum centenum SW]